MSAAAGFIIGVFIMGCVSVLYGFFVKTRWGSFLPKEDQPWYQELPTDLDERDLYE